MKNTLFAAHAEKSLVLDCLSINIEQLGSEEPLRFSGSGTISQSSSGTLLLKMLVPNTTENDANKIYTNPLTQVLAGQILPDFLYFSLTAETVQGETWECDRFFPSVTLAPNIPAMVVSGKLRLIKQSSPFSQETTASRISIYFNIKQEFPCNSVTSVEKKVSGNVSAMTSSIDVADFNAAGYHFRIQNEEDWLVVSADQESKKLPANFLVRICETLSFIFSREFNPAIVTLIQPRTQTTTLYSYKEDKKNHRGHPPLQTQIIDQSNYFWTLFDKYLSHIIGFDKPYWHPVSGIIISIIRATEASLDAQALSLSIAVEGILKLSFPDLSSPSQDTLGQLTLLTQLLKESNLEENFKIRIEGLASSIKKARPKDKLEELIKTGLIRKEIVKVWASLRHAQAHADSQNPEKVEKLIWECQVARTLLNELILIAIGYKGNYTDYSINGWPTRKIAEKILPPQSTI